MIVRQSRFAVNRPGPDTVLGADRSHFAKFRHVRVAPKVFDLVEIAGLGVEYMYHGVEIVHQNPLRVARPFGMRRRGLEFFLHLFVNAVGDCLDVGIGIALADDKKICWRVAEFPQVKLHNFFAFFVADTLDDEVVELFEVRLLCPPG